MKKQLNLCAGDKTHRVISRQGIPPMLTVMEVPASIWCPIMVTDVPPSMGPIAGVMPVILGSWAKSYLSITVADQRKANLVLLLSLSVTGVTFFKKTKRKICPC